MLKDFENKIPNGLVNGTTGASRPKSEIDAWLNKFMPKSSFPSTASNMTTVISVMQSYSYYSKGLNNTSDEPNYGKKTAQGPVLGWSGDWRKHYSATCWSAWDSPEVKFGPAETEERHVIPTNIKDIDDMPLWRDAMSILSSLEQYDIQLPPDNLTNLT